MHESGTLTIFMYALSLMGLEETDILIFFLLETNKTNLHGLFLR